MVTVIIDSPDRISASFDIVDELTTEHGLVTSEMVLALAAITSDEQLGGLHLAEPES